MKSMALSHLLDTALPTTWPVGLGMNALGVMTSRGGVGRPEAELIEHLVQDPRREAIEGLDVRSGAALRSLDLLWALPNVRRVAVSASGVVDLGGLRDLPQLEWLTLGQDQRPDRTLDVVAETSVANLWLEIKRPAEQRAVMACPKLRRLHAAKWADADGRGIASETLEELVLVAGRLRSFAEVRCPTLRAVHCARIRTLQDVTGLPAETLVIEGCPAVRYETLAACPRLRYLKLVSQSSLNSLAFVAGCRDLERLVVTASKVSGSIAETLAPPPKLRTVHLEGAEDATLAELSHRWRAVRFSNRNAAWEQNTRGPLTGEDWALFI